MMRRYMLVAMAALMIASLTGLVLRFGLAYGFPAWVHNYLAWRHAHSHLMYFGWGTLGLMALIWHFLPSFTGRPLPRGVHWQMGLTAVAALLSFPAFLPAGYATTAIGSFNLPLGSIVSGWNGLLWIVFALLYIRATSSLVERPLPVRLWDWAIFLLLLACAGAMGLVALIVIDHPSVALRQTMLHLFLELVAVGWFTLALLGALWAWVARQTTLPGGLPALRLGVALAPTFFLGIAPALVPQPIFWLSALANAAAAVFLALHLRAFWQYRRYLPILARFGLALLVIYIVIAFMLLAPGVWQWSAGTQLRVFFLHALLLGWMSSALLGLNSAQWSSAFQGLRLQGLRRFSIGAWITGVGLMLPALLALGLVSIVTLLPVRWWLVLAAWSTVPVMVAIFLAVYVLLFSVSAAVSLRPSDTVTDTVTDTASDTLSDTVSEAS